MLQPVGGMDAIVRAFAKSARRRESSSNSGGGECRSAAPAIARTSSRSITRPGKRSAIDADFVILHAIPLSVLKSIPADFTPPVKRRRSRPARHSIGPAGEGGVRGAAALVGDRPAALWRHQLDRPRHHADLVSLAWLSRQEGRAARSLYLAPGPRPEVYRHDSGRAPCGGDRGWRTTFIRLRQTGRTGGVGGLGERFPIRSAPDRMGCRSGRAASGHIRSCLPATGHFTLPASI